MKSKIRAILIDLSGTLHIEDQPTTNAIDALKKLRNANVNIKFVTNTTKESGETLFNRLTTIGFQLEKSEIFSSLSAAVKYITTLNLKPYYLLSEDARRDFPIQEDDDNVDGKNAVVVGLAPDKFHYDNLNKAFNLLIDTKCPLIAIHEGKYYKSKSSGLALGPGCFTRGLEYAANTKAIIVGKPNAQFFNSARPDNIQSNEECIMIGDDILDDIKGAMDVGMKGILVRTGKYRADVTINPEPTKICENFADAVDWLFENDFMV